MPASIAVAHGPRAGLAGLYLGFLRHGATSIWSSKTPASIRRGLRLAVCVLKAGTEVRGLTLGGQVPGGLTREFGAKIAGSPLACFLRTALAMPSAVALLPVATEPRESLASAGVANAQKLADAAKTERAGVVAAVRTPITAEQARSLIAGALERMTGEPPSKEQVAILTAQWAHETGRGASMYNYNFAGIKGTSPEGLSVMQRTREGYGATERTITDGFRAYRTAEEGADDYVALLQRRFPAALEASKAGDPAGCVRALKQAGYFTGDEVAYTRSVTQMARELAPDSLDFAPPSLPSLPVDYATLADGRDYGAGIAAGTPFVPGAAMNDHILRAALRILATPAKDERSGAST